MTTTRRLDILAIIGCILAVAAIVIPVANYAYLPQLISSMSSGSKTALMRWLPTADMRADLMLPNRSEARVEDKAVRRSVISKFEAAAAKYPNSARLQFRLGTVADEPQASEALNTAAKLDQNNAIPLYALARMASRKGQWDQATSLLTQANHRSRVHTYPYPLDACKGNGLVEMLIVSENLSVSSAGHILMRSLTKDLVAHAWQQHKEGETQESLAVIGQLKEMGWKLIRKDDGSLMDMLVGMTLIQLVERTEKHIYTATGDKAGLERIARDENEFVRLRAGSNAYLATFMDGPVQRSERSTALSIPLAGSAGAGSMITILLVVWWSILRWRSRGAPASEHHVAATDMIFAPGRLIRLCALVIVAVASFALLSLYVLTDDTSGMVLGSACPTALVLIVAAWASVVYKKAFRTAAESVGETVPKPWKGYPIADKRERQRRLTGVMGGVMVAIGVWGVLVSAYMKTTMDAYPWQIERAFAGIYQREQQYVCDLVSGKIMIPQKYILEQQKKAAEQKK